MNKNISGQALIMIVLVIALVLTVIAASSYKMTVETQSSKLQEESVRALAAADSGIEVGLRLANVNLAAGDQTHRFSDQSLDLPGIDAEKSQILITNTPNDAFVSPIVLKDDQFAFYTSDYPSFTNSYAGDLNIYFTNLGLANCGSDVIDRTTPALELTFVYGVGATNNIARTIAEPCFVGKIISGDSGLIVSAIGPYPVSGVNFDYRISPINTGAYPNLKMIIVRSLFSNTRLGFVGSALPVQGKNIEARAFSISGPSKIVTIFQSLPQIPADLYVTTF